MGLFDAIMRYSDFYQAQEIDELNELLEKYDKQNNRDSSAIQDDAYRLDSQDAQLALLFRTLYDLCVKKGVFTKTEFKKMLKKTDLEDGVKDGMLKKK